MINATGKGLSVLIASELGQDWQTFAAWYSVSRNLPDARVAVAVRRTSAAPTVEFQWARRLQVPLFYHDQLNTKNSVEWAQAIRLATARSLIVGPVLVISPFSLVTGPLEGEILGLLNGSTDIYDRVWFLTETKHADKVLDAFFLDARLPPEQPDRLCPEAKECVTASSLVSCLKGVGKWLPNSRGCPFSSAAGLASIDMTVNERRVIELWKRMVSLFQAVV